MQARHVLLILTLALAATTLGHAAVPTDLRFLAPLPGEFTPDVPVRLPLPRQVIAGAASDFADVRLFDDQGLETPYVIYAQNPPPSYPFPFQVLSYSQSEAGDTIVLQRPQDTGPFWELAVQTTARDFHKAVRLQASHDRATWDEVTADAIFDFSSRIDVRKTTLAFPETDTPYLRLLLKDAVPPEADAAAVQLRYKGLEFSAPGKSVKPFRINGISGRGGAVQAADHVYDSTTFVQPDTRIDTQGNTLVLLGRVNLPVAQLTLTVDNPYYHRRVEIWAADTDKDDTYHQVASGVMYKLPGVATADNTLHVQHTQYPYLRLKILNGDNPPLRLQQVEAAWVRQNLYFIPAAGGAIRSTLVVSRCMPPSMSCDASCRHSRCDWSSMRRCRLATCSRMHATTPIRPRAGASSWRRHSSLWSCSSSPAVWASGPIACSKRRRVRRRKQGRLTCGNNRCIEEHQVYYPCSCSERTGSLSAVCRAIASSTKRWTIPTGVVPRTSRSSSFCWCPRKVHAWP